MNTIIDILKEHRNIVIDYYNESKKEITLKAYMEDVIAFFEAHKGKANKAIKGESYIACRYIYEACQEANRHACWKSRREFRNMRMEELAQRGGGRGYIAKNF